MFFEACCIEGAYAAGLQGQTLHNSKRDREAPRFWWDTTWLASALTHIGLTCHPTRMQRPSGHRFLRLESALAAASGLAGCGENGEESSITDSCDGGDTEAGDADRVDRRELLAALGATAGTSVLAGCPGNNGGTSGETREFEAKPAAFTNGAVEQLGLPVKETTTHETSNAVSVGGEEYRVNSTQKITTYLGDESIRYRLGILSSPLARIDGEITSPVVNRDLSEFLTSKDGQRLLKALNVPSDWMNSPTRLERESLSDPKNRCYRM